MTLHNANQQATAFATTRQDRFRLSLAECMIGVVIAACYLAAARQTFWFPAAVIAGYVINLAVFNVLGEDRRRGVLQTPLKRLLFGVGCWTLLSAYLFASVLVAEFVPLLRWMGRFAGESGAFSFVIAFFLIPYYLSAVPVFVLAVSRLRHQGWRHTSSGL